MIVDDPDIGWSSVIPGEANAPLVVDPDAVLAEPIALQCFQPVSWRHAEVIETPCTVHQAQFPKRRSLYVRRKFSASLTGPDAFRLSIRETLDHNPI
jgi:hypothetical protein